MRGVALSSDDSFVVTGSCDNTARVWDTATGTCTKVLEGHSFTVAALAVAAAEAETVKAEFAVALADSTVDSAVLMVLAIPTDSVAVPSPRNLVAPAAFVVVVAAAAFVAASVPCVAVLLLVCAALPP